MTYTIRVLLIAVLLTAASAAAEKIRLDWAYDNSAIIDGFRLYQTIPVKIGEDWITEFDYAAPVATEDFPDGRIPADTRSIEVDLPGFPDKVTKYVFTARAFWGDAQSEDSNSVSYKVVNLPPDAPLNLSGEYDVLNGVVHLMWDQPPDDYRIDHWEVFFRISDDDGPFISLGTVDHGQELTLTRPFDAVADGELKTVAFTVLARRRSGIYSGNAAEFFVVIDRRNGVVPPVENLRLSVEIPVE